MEFYFPLAHAEIDWSKEYVFLDQELRAVVQDAELGKRFVDKLVRVNVLNGDEKWIYIHVEVQGTKQAEFAKRMFVYNYRIFDRYDRPVASLAVLADTHKQWKPTSYSLTLPEWLNSKVWQELETIEENENMEYITSVERIGMVRGQYTLLKRMLEHRFGLLPEWASEKLKSAKTKELEAWSVAIFTAPTLEAVFNKSDVS